MTDAMSADQVRDRVLAFLAEHDPAVTDPVAFNRARFDAGLAWVSFPEGKGGLGAPRDLQGMVDELFAGAGAPGNSAEKNGIGLGMAAPTILAHGTPEQHERFLRPLYTGEEIWCQLFSEPGAGSDLAALGTRAVLDGDTWVVDGQKVWTSMGHLARWGILVARTDPDAPKHRGLTYFICDMTDPGVEVRPLRQMTGEAEFNEVFLTSVKLPDALRLGEVGDGWRVAQTTLNNERVAIGGQAAPREAGMIGLLTELWREREEARTPGLHDAVIRAWIDAEVGRLSAERVRQQLAAGSPGPEGSGVKLTFATLNQKISGLAMELLGEDALRYPDWTLRRPEATNFYGRGAQFAYLRAKGNSIEGGTSEILRTVISERVLGLPPEHRVDKDVPWRESVR
jgi:alkylation response protein AidB-like acyl-CoA dehydrogenase